MCKARVKLLSTRFYTQLLSMELNLMAIFEATRNICQGQAKGERKSNSFRSEVWRIVSRSSTNKEGRRLFNSSGYRQASLKTNTTKSYTPPPPPSSTTYNPSPGSPFSLFRVRREYWERECLPSHNHLRTN